MKIGIFSKIEMLGGSERRCIELVNGIAEYTSHDAFLFSEGDMPSRVKALVNTDEVKVCSNLVVNPKEKTKNVFELMDKIIVVNTDSKRFTHIDYWRGLTSKHNTPINISNVGDMTFLFNFIVSPSRHLYTLKRELENTRIITANSKFFNEITKQDRYELVRDLPRIKLESPIDKTSVDFPKKKVGSKISFGMHSKSLGNKWNTDWEKSIKKINQRLGENRIDFHFMGMNEEVSKRINKIKNVHIYKENTYSIRDYLNKVDVFTFFPCWKREEPWARVIGEAMMSGCPIVATAKGGNLDQIINGNNGFLFKNTNELMDHVVYFTEHPNEIVTMGKNSRRLALDFDTRKVVSRLIEFIEKE